MGGGRGGGDGHLIGIFFKVYSNYASPNMPTTGAMDIQVFCVEFYFKTLFVLFTFLLFAMAE